MSEKPFQGCTLWLVAGSQELYGRKALDAVAANTAELAAALDRSAEIPVHVISTPVVTSPNSIRRLLLEANSDDRCVGIVVWMHTFSPARMCIPGLTVLQKPLLHLHTKFNRELPWGTIDMDFMNLNQSATAAESIARLDPRVRIAVGDRVELAVDTDRILFFDAETGETIRAVASPSAVGSVPR